MSHTPFVYTTADDAPSYSAEEEAVLIDAAQHGDEDSKTALLAAYGPALRHAVHRFTRHYEGAERVERREEAQSVALVTFFEVLNSHDASKSPRLAGRLPGRLRAALAEAEAAGSPMFVPERTRSRFFGILRKYDGDLDAALDAAPDHGMSRATFNEVRAALLVDSVDSGVEDGHEFDESAASSLWHDSRSETGAVEDRMLAEFAFTAVDDGEERVIRYAFGYTSPGLPDGLYHPDSRVAYELDMSRPTVQRRRVSGVAKMRKALALTD